MVSATKELFDLNFTLQLHHTIKNGFWTWRTSRDVNINWNELVDTTNYIIALFERSTTNGASANSYNVLWLCNFIVQTLENRCHFIGNCTSTHNQVCLTWRVTSNLKAEAREVVTCTTDSHELNTTT